MKAHVHQAGGMLLPSAPPYRLNDQVFQVVDNGMARLLDFEQGRFYGLDRMGTHILTLLLKTSPQEAVACLVRQYNVPEDRIAGDIQTLVRTLRVKKVLVPTRQRPKSLGTVGLTLCGHVVPRAYRLISLLFCQTRRSREAGSASTQGHAVPSMPLPSRRLVRVLLTFSWFSVRMLGWTTTITLYQQWPRQRCAETALNRELIIAIDRHIRAEASRTLFLPMACKERALTAYHILRSLYGYPAMLVVGTRRYPFEAHAWVQCADLVLTDEAEHCALFTPVAQYA